MIKILTESGQKIGYGHLSRCSALYDAAKKMNINSTIYIHGINNTPVFISDHHTEFVNWLQIESLRTIIQPEDYVIVDSYLASYEILDYIASLAKKVLYIDDTHRIDYPKGIVINPSVDIENIDYRNTRETKYYYGSSFVILRNPFINVKRMSISIKISQILIIIGGTDPLNITEQLVKNFCPLFRTIKFKILTQKSNLFEHKVHSDNILFYSNLSAKEVKSIMLESDMAISASGQTLYELIATQTPYIGIKTATNQSNNIASLNKHNLIPYIISDLNNLIKQLRISMSTLMSYENRQKMVKQFSAYFNEDGAFNIIKKLTETP